MAKLELNDSWATLGNVDTLQAALNGFFKKHRMRIIGKQTGEMHVRQGFPKLVWLLRGHFMPQRWLPKRAMVRLNSNDAGVAVRASIEETSQFQTLSPRLRGKYQIYFDWWMAELRNQMR